MIGATATYEFFADAVLSAVDVAARPVLTRQGERLAGEIRRSIVPRGRPSRPGETPTSVTGRLRQSIESTYDPRSLKVVVAPRSFGAGDVPADLEFGTATMAARPYLSPVLDKFIPSMIADWHHAMGR